MTKPSSDDVVNGDCSKPKENNDKEERGSLSWILELHSKSKSLSDGASLWWVLVKDIWNLSLSHEVMSWSSLTLCCRWLYPALNKKIFVLFCIAWSGLSLVMIWLMGWNLAPTSFPRYLFCPRPLERGCHRTRGISPRFWWLPIDWYSDWFFVSLALTANSWNNYCSLWKV